jgi:hypothetical protein
MEDSLRIESELEQSIHGNLQPKIKAASCPTNVRTLAAYA